MRIYGNKPVESDVSESRLLDLVTRQLSTHYKQGAFDVKKDGEFVYVTPVLPTEYNIQAENSNIFRILYQVFFPFYTVLNTPKADIVATESNALETARALRYRLLKGKPTQLKINGVDELISNRNFKINNQVSIDMNDVTHVLVTGQSGSGKSYTTNLIMDIIATMSRKNIYKAKMTIIDPKLSSLSDWSLKNSDVVECLMMPNAEFSNDNDLLTQVNEELQRLCAEMTQRQQKMLNNQGSAQQFEHKWLIIDEVIGLQVSASKPAKENFHNNLSKLLVMGREVNIHVMLISQSFDSKWVPVVAREQANLLIAMGVGNQLRFMFDSSEVDDVVIPYERGGGLLKIIDNKHPSQLLPVIFPCRKEVR